MGWKKTIIYLLLPTVALLALLEGTARIIEIWRPPWKVDYGWGFDPGSRLFVPSAEEPGIMITDPFKEVSFPQERFPTPKPKNHFRAFMLGESSVNYIQTRLKAMALGLTFRFQGKYMIEMLDAGGLAYGTHRLTPIAAEILDYEPDLVLLYIGHNEFEEAEQMRFVHLGTLPLQKVLYKSAFCRLIRDGIGAVQVSAIQRERNQRIMAQPEADYASGARHEYTPVEVQERLSAYRNNLTIILELCRKRGVPVIIGTVASNLWKPDLPTEAQKQKVKALYDQGEYEKGLALARQILRTSVHHQASDAENEVIRDLARQYDVPIADVEAAVIAAEPHGIPGETLLSDRCHLNEEGKCLLIRVFQEQIARLLEQRKSTATPLAPNSREGANPARTASLLLDVPY